MVPVGRIIRVSLAGDGSHSNVLYGSALFEAAAPDRFYLVVEDSPNLTLARYSPDHHWLDC